MPPSSTAKVEDRADRAPQVFDFRESTTTEAAVLGGKGAGLVQLSRLGLPVPPGFVVSTQAGLDYLGARRLPESLLAEIGSHLERLEQTTGRRFDDPRRPLLVSVRSGAPVSMPGMMDTVLNVGLTPTTAQALADETGDRAFSWACYARMAEAYARIVRGVPVEDIEDALFDQALGRPAGEQRSRAIVTAVQELLATRGDAAIPDNARAQIREAVEAVFRSWESGRAKAYRAFRGIDDGLGTAAVIQCMVFGNRGTMSGSGVAFTRDPSSGAPGAFGDFLFDAQGEDVVDGSRDPLPLEALAERLPATFDDLRSALALIERHAGDLCEVEFTVDDSSLWILQTRVGQRSGPAAVRTAVDLVDEGRITADEAARRISPGQIEATVAPSFAAAPLHDDVLMRGTPASPGAVVGALAFDVERALAASASGVDVILVRPTTSPSDVAGFIAAKAVVTGRGGRTSHAAVVARGMGRPAVCGVGDITVSDDGSTATIDGARFREGLVVSLDGDRGIVAQGALPLVDRAADPLVRRVLDWCRELVRVPILSSVDPEALVFDDPTTTSLTAANAAIAAANDSGQAPPIAVSARFAAAADGPLRGRTVGLCCLDDVVSWPALARDLEPAGARRDAG